MLFFDKPERGDAGLAAFEDENTVEAGGVPVLEGAARGDGVVGSGHEETVLDDDEPNLVARSVVVGNLGVLVLDTLRDAGDGEWLDVGGHAGVPEWLFLSACDIGDGDGLDVLGEIDVAVLIAPVDLVAFAC